MQASKRHAKGKKSKQQKSDRPEVPRLYRLPGKNCQNSKHHQSDYHTSATGGVEVHIHSLLLLKLMVHRGGFEPPYVIDGQIYSLLPLTTRPPVHILPHTI